MGILVLLLSYHYSSVFASIISIILLVIALSYRYNIQKEEIATKDKILYKQSRFASMGEMISNIAHQWRQALNHVYLNLAVVDKLVKNENIVTEFIYTKFKKRGLE
ncbi:MAG: hypothetical protein J7J96_01830 [Sulfurimonas sp.]|nr:hypothetical protein [Sulfurimonas sp.]